MCLVVVVEVDMVDVEDVVIEVDSNLSIKLAT